MAESSSRRTCGGPSPMDKLTDDLLVEIFSRVSYKLLRRCACVSRRWRDLIAHPDNRQRLPQTLAGFFYHAPARSFADVSGTGPPFLFDPTLAFLPDREREGLDLVDGCNGLLLCCCYRFADPDEFDYLVINPASKSWVAVPGTRRCSSEVQTVRLGFEPAVSSHFHVFEFELEWDEDSDSESDDDDGAEGHVLGVRIYSSQTGLWSYKQSGWRIVVELHEDFKSVFVSGTLYVVTTCCLIGTVDVEGRTWRLIDFPSSLDSPFFDIDVGFMVSRGKLHLANVDGTDGDELAIWLLEDCNSGEWSLKHSISFKHLVGKKYFHFHVDQFIVVAIHPDRNMVFFVFGNNKRLMSYDMDSGEVHMTTELGESCIEHYIPYVPLFSESVADGQK